MVDTIAVKLGVNKAMFLQQIDYLLCESKHIYDGQIWIYNTAEQWKKFFPYWSAPTIRRLVKGLRDDQKLIVTTDRYNQRGGDKTSWFTINVDVFVAMFGTLPRFVGKAKASDQCDQSLFESSDHIDHSHNPSPRTLDNSTEKPVINVRAPLPKRSTKTSTKTKKLTNYARSRPQRGPQQMDGWLVGSTTGDGFGSTSTDPDPEQTPPISENVPATNRAEADPPNTSPAPPPTEEQHRIVALLMGEGITEKKATKLAGQAGCSCDSTKLVIAGFRRDCKKDRTLGTGVLVYRIEEASKLGNANFGQNTPRRYNTFEGEPIYTDPVPFDDDAPAPLPAVATIAPPPVEDDLIAHWGQICETELGNLKAELEHSQLIALEGGYQVVIADPRDLELVQRGQRAIKMALRGRPFALAVAAA